MYSDLKVSVIVPVYNAEKSIKHCIESVLSQSYIHFELLLVNDGSKDRSYSICCDYAKRDNRIRCFNKENTGVSATRNLALKEAKGEYVVFLDSDDYFDCNYIEYMIAKMRPKSIVLSGYRRVNLSGDILYLDQLQDANISKETIIAHDSELWNTILRYGTVCGKLLDLNIIREQNLYFNETLSLHEDHLFYFRYLGLIDEVNTLSYIGYNYVTDQMEVSLSTRKTHDSDMLLRAYNLTFSEIKNIESNFDVDLCRCAKSGISYVYSFFLHAIKNSYISGCKKEERLKLLSSLKKRELRAYYHPKSPKGYILKLVLFLFPRFVSDSILKNILR